MRPLLFVRMTPMHPEQPQTMLYCDEVRWFNQTDIVTVSKGTKKYHPKIRSFTAEAVDAVDLAAHVRRMLDADRNHVDLFVVEALVNAVLGDRD